jgi:hypothetical protein
MLTKRDFPKKEQFPADLQSFYLNPPKSIKDFCGNFNYTCLLIDESEIDKQNNGIFSDYHGKRPDQIHYSIGIGLIENKSTNYGKNRIESQFTEFKRYFESKYNEHVCKIKYFVLYAPILSDKLKKELKLKSNDNTLVYASKQNKQFKINNIPVYFIRKVR